MISRIVLILSCAAVVAGCGAASGSDGRSAVAAAFYPLAYAAERIGAGDVDVDNLTPAGSEPHDLELAPKTVARVIRADLVLYLGDDFQPAVTSAVDMSEGQSLDLLAGLPVRGHDPHVWLDPLLYARIVERIGRALHAPHRAAAVVADVKQLDREYRRGLAHCARRELVTSHAAFGYLARRYGLEQVAITGIAPEAEPTAQDLERVAEEVRRTHATTVFFEPLVSPRLARTVAHEVGARTAVLDPIESSNGPTYFQLMRRNLESLRQALGCR
jgi:zinc transport system substrate-binding protein